PVYLRDVFEVRRGDENPIPYSVEVLHRSKQTLAPALSLSERKREKNIQRLDKTERGETTDRLENVLPLPRRGGEGRGEGAALSDSAPLTPARSVLLAIEMKEGNIIGQFNETIRTVLDAAGSRLPEGMEIISLSDQPASVAHRIHHFMRWFIEAVIVVVLVALFLMDWRSALVVATAIPLTVAMTFGGMAL